MCGVVLHAHPVRGESHNQHNTTGEVATEAALGDILTIKVIQQNFQQRNFETFAKSHQTQKCNCVEFFFSSFNEIIAI